MSAQTTAAHFRVQPKHAATGIQLEPECAGRTQRLVEIREAASLPRVPTVLLLGPQAQFLSHWLANDLPTINGHRTGSGSGCVRNTVESDIGDGSCTSEHTGVLGVLPTHCGKMELKAKFIWMQKQFLKSVHNCFLTLLSRELFEVLLNQKPLTIHFEIVSCFVTGIVCEFKKQ